MPFSSSKHKGYVSNYTGNGVHCIGAFEYYQINDPTGTIDPLTGQVRVVDIATQIGFYSSDDAGANYSEIVVNKGNLALSANNATLSNITVWGSDSILTQGRGDGRYFPLNANIVSGNATIAGRIDAFGSGNGTLNTRQIYGISKTNTLFGTEYQFAVGMNYASPAQGSILMARAFDPAANRGLSQSEIRIDHISAILVSTNKQPDGTLFSRSSFGAGWNGATLYYEDLTTLTFMDVGSQGIFFFGVTFGSNNSPPGPNELMTRATCDNRYEPITRRN
jgi:hypothetical protein